jgi:hypothetical protein
VAGVVSSGLFRIEGPATSDLVKLGEIEVQEFPATNELRVSCLLSDLTADAYFSAWYDPADPAMDIAAFTQRITILGGASEADRTSGADCYLREFSIAPIANQLPVLSNAEFLGSGQGAFARIEYTDADANCPVISEVVFDGTQSFEMYPETLDYGAMVSYRSDSGLAPLADESWDTAVFRFSDDQENVVEYEVTATGMETIPPAVRVSVAPNPFNASTTISLILPAAVRVRVSVYDAAGGRVAMILDDDLPAGAHDMNWNGRNAAGRDLGSGVYFLRIKADRYRAERKIVLLR